MHRRSTNISKQAKASGRIGRFITVAVGTVLVLRMASTSEFLHCSFRGCTQGIITRVNPLDVISNAKQLKTWRQNLRDLCSAAKTASDVEAIASIQISGFAFPTSRVPQPHTNDAVKLCRDVIVDFGANIGDTLSHMVDVGMISCERIDLEARTDASHFNIETKRFELIKRRNLLTRNLEKIVQIQDPLTGPEDYCYYGVEGNPHFTERLHNIEDLVMAIRPRPIQHMHFFTESVGAGADGMTKLYLDTINDKHNFWGSSIYKDHQDVRKSAEGKDVETVAAPVMGYTIGTLMRKTLVAFDPKATEDEKKGGHLILKVDIEGGEYSLLHQAVEEGTLCEFVQMGNTADLFVEFHSQKVTGKHEFVGKNTQMKDALRKCGVKFRNLAAWWE